MISKKEKMIVEAVNFFHGDLNFYSSVGDFNQCTREMSVGDFVPSCTMTREEAVKFHQSNGLELNGVDSVSIFDSALSSADISSISDSPRFETGQRVYLKDGLFSDHKWFFGCYLLELGKALIIRAGGYAEIAVNKLSLDPIEPPKMVELPNEKESITLAIIRKSLESKDFQRGRFKSLRKWSGNGGNLLKVRADIIRGLKLVIAGDYIDSSLSDLVVRMGMAECSSACRNGGITKLGDLFLTLANKEDAGE